MNFDLKTAIATVAPTLATMLGGPLAGTAVTALAGAFGLAPTSTADDVTKVVQAGMTPDTIAAVRKADQDHAERLRQMDIDLAKLNADHEAAMAATDAADRDSARKREIAVGGWTTPALAWTVVVLVVVCEAAVLFGMGAHGVDPVVLGRIMGTLDSALMLVLAYYFGSSAGSRLKDQQRAAEAMSKP